MTQILKDCAALTRVYSQDKINPKAWLEMLENVGIQEICEAFKIYQNGDDEEFPTFRKIKKIIETERLKNPKYQRINAELERYHKIMGQVYNHRILSKSDASFALDYARNHGQNLSLKIYEVLKNYAN